MADILIKNIGGLPEDGDLTLTITPKGQVILGGCIFTSNFGKEVKAVALPEHHGRLIDEAELVRVADDICRNPLGAILEDVSTIVEATE